MDSWNSEIVESDAAECSALEEGMGYSESSTTSTSETDTLWHKLSRSLLQSVNLRRLLLTLSSAWDLLENNLAEFFGLNASRYQWAIDEHNYLKTQELLDSFGDNINAEQDPPVQKGITMEEPKNQEFSKRYRFSQN